MSGPNRITSVLKKQKREATEGEPERLQFEKDSKVLTLKMEEWGLEPRNAGSLWEMDKARKPVVF